MIDSGYEEDVRIFEKTNPQKSNYYPNAEFDAYDFIKTIRNEITDMDQIESITITGNEENDVSYNRSYTYNLKTKEYTGKQIGCEFEKDGSSGGDLRFSDLDQCDMTEKTKQEAEDDAWDEFMKKRESLIADSLKAMTKIKEMSRILNKELKSIEDSDDKEALTKTEDVMLQMKELEELKQLFGFSDDEFDSEDED